MVTWDDDWHRDYILSVPDILVDEETLHLDLLPELQKDHATGRQTLQGLHTTRLALSLNNDDMIYLMAKVRTCDKKAWVLAVDMRNRKLKDVGVFRAERTLGGIALSYTFSTVSKYFSTSQVRCGGWQRKRQPVACVGVIGFVSGGGSMVYLVPALWMDLPSECPDLSADHEDISDGSLPPFQT
uniref:DUF1618 domain-containing protein n=1 Tax=Leersia perrieri TaxID=77586 RepID=A0A0D9VQ62_9ORYZ